MIRFLIKGILNDRSRSLLPVIVISLGVALTVFMVCWLNGVLGESISMNANFNTGHVKVMTRAYADDENQMPAELSIIGADSITGELQKEFPQLEWVQRIRFGAIIDFPDENGETRAQGPVTGWAIDLFNSTSEKGRFNLEKSIVAGKMPSKNGEALITSDFATRYKIKTGDSFTLFGTTMDGGMAFMNFTASAMVRFGSSAIDRGAVIIDISDAQKVFAMEDAASVILGFYKDGEYDNDAATLMMNSFNEKSAADKSEFAPEMVRLTDQGGMAEYVGIADMMGTIMAVVFILAMSIVLWNAGLLGGLRRYTEFGIRLAMGEEKNHIYRTLLTEALVIGLIGSVTGTILGLGVAFYLQEVGLNIGGMMQNSSVLIPSVVRAHITHSAFYIGFIPGVISMVIGNALSGIGIYKRNTAMLFKELEV